MAALQSIETTAVGMLLVPWLGTETKMVHRCVSAVLCACLTQKLTVTSTLRVPSSLLLGNRKAGNPCVLCFVLLSCKSFTTSILQYDCCTGNPLPTSKINGQISSVWSPYRECGPKEDDKKDKMEKTLRPNTKNISQSASKNSRIDPGKENPSATKS